MEKIKADIPVRDDLPPYVPEPPKSVVNVRPLNVRKVDIKSFGHTQDCLGCRSMRMGSAPVGHSDVCRKRIMELLSQSPECADRVEKRKQIVDEAVAAAG